MCSAMILSKKWAVTKLHISWQLSTQLAQYKKLKHREFFTSMMTTT